MITLPLAQAKNQFSELIGRVERGETVAVTRRGKPVAQLVGVPASHEAPNQQREQVSQAFARLRQLGGGLSLEGDLKAISREGLA